MSILRVIERRIPESLQDNGNHAVYVRVVRIEMPIGTIAPFINRATIEQSYVGSLATIDKVVQVREVYPPDDTTGRDWNTM